MLTGKQVERICTALGDAYTLDDLRQLVRYELNQRLDKIVNTNSAFNKVVFDLVDWAEANDAVVPLVAAAAKSRPNDAALAQLAAEISAAQSQRTDQGTLQRIDLDQQLRREWPYRRLMLEPIEMDLLEQASYEDGVTLHRYAIRGTRP